LDIGYWILEIQKYDIQYEYIKGSQNIAAVTFSRLINRPKVEANTTILTTYPPHIINLISLSAHVSNGAHWGEKKTFEVLSKYYPL
jgi:hypothetical protein